VLVAEDNAVNMMITVALLEQWGVRVAQATDGAQVLGAVRQAEGEGRPFDAVLMDLQMPRLSGHQAARALRERHGERTPPIIALTAAALVSEREEALSAGMSDFLTKPIDTERMRSVLAAHVRRKAKAP
jgi:CheY-like chemotaxis protein